MMHATALPDTPAEAEAFFRRLRSALWFLPRSDRKETIESIATHLREATESDSDIREVLDHLGTPETIASQAAHDYEVRSGKTAVPRYFTPARAAQFAALAFAIAASLFTLLVPLGVAVTESSDGQHMVETTSLLSSASSFTIAAALSPVVLALVPLFFRGRVWRGVTIAVTVLLLAFAIIGGFSVGLFFLPAVIAEALAAVLPRRSRLRRRS